MVADANVFLPLRHEKCTLPLHRALQQGQGKRERQRGEREEEVQRQRERGEEEAQIGKRDQEGERRSQAAD